MHFVSRRLSPLALFVTFALMMDGVAVIAVLSRVLNGHMIDDWFTFYAAGTMVRTGHGAQLYDSSAQSALQQMLGSSPHAMGFTLPVFAAFVFAPLSRLSLNVSYLIWFAMNVTLIVALAGLSWRLLAELPRSIRAVFLISAVLLIPLEAALLGQVDCIVLAGIVGCYALLRARRQEFGGAALALALFKPHLAGGVLLLLVSKRQWRALAGFAVVAVPLLLIPAVMVGPHVLADQARLLGSFTTTSKGYGVDAHTMINIRGSVIDLTGSSDVWLWLPLLVAIGGVALLVATHVWNERPALHPQSWALACLLPLLYSPHLHIQSLVLLLPAVALYLVASQSSDQPIVDIKYVLYGLIALTVLWGLVLVGISLMAFLTMGAFWALSRRWPAPQAGELPLPARAELALAS